MSGIKKHKRKTEQDPDTTMKPRPQYENVFEVNIQYMLNIQYVHVEDTLPSFQTVFKQH